MSGSIFTGDSIAWLLLFLSQQRAVIIHQQVGVFAQGIFGQGIFIDPARRLVIASNANWPVASDPAYWEERQAFYSAVQAALDARQPPSAPAQRR